MRFSEIHEQLEKVNGRHYYVNPTSIEAKSLWNDVISNFNPNFVSNQDNITLYGDDDNARVRGFVDYMGELYVWDGYYKTHADAIHDLGIPLIPPLSRVEIFPTEEGQNNLSVFIYKSTHYEIQEMNAWQHILPEKLVRFIKTLLK